jgi:pantothenate kinase
MEDVRLDQLVADARALLAPGRRVLLGLTGAPGAGKSTVAEQLVGALDGDAMLVGLDGFHLADDELRRMGRWQCKGAVDTFDAAGYVHLLRRLRARDEPVVYAPRFDRSLEESIGSAVPVPSEVPLIVTEGNYLLVDTGPWASVRGLLDACWYVEPGDDVRLERLVARHQRFGRSLDEARQRSYGTDETNAELIGSTKVRADRVVRLVP